jgi:GDP-4-dehydro-6-deoxy-D-mannose reductase
VRDIARGYRLLGLKGEKGEAYNLASGRSTPIGEILNMLVKMARVVVEVRAEPERLRKKQVMDVRGSFQKAHACCGWKPEFPLDKTLRDLLNWYRDQKPARPS